MYRLPAIIVLAFCLAGSALAQSTDDENTTTECWRAACDWLKYSHDKERERHWTGNPHEDKDDAYSERDLHKSLNLKEADRHSAFVEPTLCRQKSPKS